MSAVEARFGAPRTRHAAVGEPPITRWDYDGLQRLFRAPARSAFRRHGRLIPRRHPTMRALRRGMLRRCPVATRLLLIDEPRFPPHPALTTSIAYATGPRCIPAPGPWPLRRAAATDDRPWIVVLPDARSLDQLHRELVFFAGDSLPVLHLPDWEVLPYDQYSPLPDLISGRLATLARLPALQRGVVLASAESMHAAIAAHRLHRRPQLRHCNGPAILDCRGERAAGPGRLQRCCPGRARRANSRCAARCSMCSRWATRRRCASTCSTTASTASGISIPIRSARSIAWIALRLLPAREFPLDEESCREFRRRFRNRFEGDPTRSAIYRGVRQNMAPPGIEFYLPLFFERTATLFEYLPAAARHRDAG